MRPAAYQITASLVVLVVALILYGGWYAALSSKSASVASLEREIVTKTETAGRIAAARAALTEIAGNEATVRSYFVSDAGVVPFIDSLEKKGQAQGAVVNVLSVANAPDTAHPSLAIALSIKGPFDAVMRTLGSIEYAPYALTLSSVNLTLNAKGIWNADLALIVGSAPSAATTTPSTRL